MTVYVKVIKLAVKLVSFTAKSEVYNTLHTQTQIKNLWHHFHSQEKKVQPIA